MNEKVISNESEPAKVYQSLLTEYESKTEQLKAQLNWLSFLRLMLFVAMIFLLYKSVQVGGALLIVGMLATAAGFFYSIRFYDRQQQQLAFYKALVKLNRSEKNFVEGGRSEYADGKEFIDPHHPFSYDLDIFGEGGLFAFLNRCSTEFGKKALAKDLLHPDPVSIRERQIAIAELRDKLQFRQYLQAHGSLLDTREKEMRQLKTWLDQPPSLPARGLYYFLMLFPAISLAALVVHLFTENEKALRLFYTLFAVNLLIAFSFVRKIMSHLGLSTSVTKVLQQYAGQLKQLEHEKFESHLLKRMQESIRTGNKPASISITGLASLFNYLETFFNLVVSTLLNGLFLFHVHILYSLEKWKSNNGRLIMPWLELLGEMEALNSFGNFSYNNPSFCQPVLREEETLVANEMGHPLIAAGKRINNSISFEQQRFVVLTGSNMSGKSTFLRTLGINLVLARSGSNVCAREFIFYPYAIYVSMRITDSLQDSESFFYAELKRLQSIIHHLESNEKVFVILDEILRGTNSNDKHNGTIGLIRKMVGVNACGIIATHDLTVSKLSQENPGYISNKCFESEIIHDELIFDYRLKEGVCTKLSASFLMRKMKIIE